MLVPGWVCRQLYNFHPQLRLAWAGKEGDGLNEGSYALIQMYHIRDAGTDEAPNTFYNRWDLDFVCDVWGNMSANRIDRGPIFNRNGGCTRDWDPIFRKPIWIANLAEFGISNEDVLSGRFLPMIKEWTIPIKRRIRESAREAGKELVQRTDDSVGEMTDFLWREAQKPDATSSNIAYKHTKEELKAWDRQKEQAAQLADYYMPPEE